MKFYLLIDISPDYCGLFSFDLPSDLNVPILRPLHPDDLKDSPFSKVVLCNDLWLSGHSDPNLIKKST